MGIIKANEAVLRENLYTFRSTIDQFYADQGKFPESLQELVDKKLSPGDSERSFYRKAVIPGSRLPLQLQPKGRLPEDLYMMSIAVQTLSALKDLTTHGEIDKMIELHNVTVQYQKDSPALSNISLKIPKGDFVFLTGSSGAGKSTLLKLVYGAVEPVRGHVVVDGQNLTRLPRKQIPYLRRNIGVVFQDFKLLNNRSVFDNVALTLEVLGWESKDIGKKVFHILKRLGIDHKKDVAPLRLSGGEQQRVALARALVNDPKILLADEPTGNLDDPNKDQILNIFREANIRGTTVLIASHDRRVLTSVHSRVVHLEKGLLQEAHDVTHQA